MAKISRMPTAVFVTACLLLATTNPTLAQAVDNQALVNQLTATWSKKSEGRVILVTSKNYSKFARRVFEKRNKNLGLDAIVETDERLPRNFSVFFVNGNPFSFREALTPNSSIIFRSSNLGVATKYLAESQQPN